MKKNYSYYILLALMFFTAPMTQAEVNTISDLFGTYKFTATMTVTEAGKAYQKDFTNECEVTIEESSSTRYQAQIVGLAGASGPETSMKASDFDASTCTFCVNNPGGINAYTFADNLAVGNSEGAYPYTPSNSPKMTFTYNPDTKNITISDFTIIGNIDHSAQTCDVYAKFTNAKLELIKSTELADLTGAWNIVAGTIDYSTYANSTLPTSYVLTLNQTSNGVYTAKFDIEGVPSFSLDGTFDGSKLTISFDNKVVDSTNNISVKDFNSAGDSGTITFAYSNDVLTGLNPLYLASGNTPLQWWSNATGTRQATADSFTWDGTYTVNTNYVFNLDNGTWDNPFEVTITQNGSSYIVSSFLGKDVYSLNSGSMSLTVADDNKSATICINGGKSGYSSAFLKMDATTYKFYHFCDGQGNRETLSLTRNDDGTITLADFGFLIGDWNEAPTASSAAAWYMGNTMTKNTTGVSSVAVDNKVNIQVVAGEIVLDSVQLVSVYDLSGRTVYQGVTDVVSNLKNGIYIVKANNTVAKVSIR